MSPNTTPRALSASMLSWVGSGLKCLGRLGRHGVPSTLLIPFQTSAGAVVVLQVDKYRSACGMHAGGKRARRERPRGHRAAEQRHELAARHSITSSATESSVGGTVRPSILAV